MSAVKVENENECDSGRESGRESGRDSGSSTDERSVDPLERKRAYQREYQKRRFHEKPGVKELQNSHKCRRTHGLSEADMATYGKHLALVYKLRKIRDTLPPEVFQMVLAEPGNV